MSKSKCKCCCKFKVGDRWLIDVGSGLRETEIEQVSDKAVLHSFYGVWQKTGDFMKMAFENLGPDLDPDNADCVTQIQSTMPRKSWWQFWK